jgi:hypothetical protein
VRPLADRLETLEHLDGVDSVVLGDAVRNGGDSLLGRLQGGPLFFRAFRGFRAPEV